MRKLIWSPQALRDLEGIRDYVAADSYRLRPGAVEIATVFRASRMFPEVK